MFFAAKPTETRSLEQMFADAKRTGTPLTYASPGVGSINHLAAAALLKASGVPGIHVPTNGAAQSMQLLLGGEVNFVLDNPTTLVPHLGAARAPKVLGVTSASPASLTGLPAPVPPLAVVLKKNDPFSWSAWFGVMAPAKATETFKSDAWSAVTKAVNTAAFRDEYEKMGFEVAPLNRGEFRAFVSSERQRLKPFVLEAKRDAE